MHVCVLPFALAHCAVAHPFFLPFVLSSFVLISPYLRILTRRVSVDEMADPETWEGEWVEKRWTPLSRAIDRGLDSIVMLFRDALNAGKHSQQLQQQQQQSQQGQGRMPANAAATTKNMIPQGQPPINSNLTEGQFMQNSPAGGPSTSSNEGAGRIGTSRSLLFAALCALFISIHQVVVNF